MKATKIKYHLPVAILVVMLACTRDAEIVIPPQQPALVVHGYIEVGDSFHISLGKTMGMKESLNTIPVVENGWMLIYENNVFADSLKFEATSGNYVSGFIAKQGMVYKLIAGAPGFANIEASSSSPLPASTASLNHILNSRSSSGGTILDDIKFSFNDPASQDNFYITALYTASSSPVCAYTHDPVIEKYTASFLPFDQGSCISSDQILFNDKTFNGAAKEITISAGNEEMKSYTDPTTGMVFKPFLKRYNVSKDHYTYFKNCLAADANSVPTFSNPVSVKGNIKNGYGLFSVFQLTTDSIP
jgi:hypothetical protein